MELLQNPHVWMIVAAFVFGGFLVWVNMRPATPLYQQGFAHGLAMCDHPADRAECYAELEHAEAHGAYGAWERGVAAALEQYPYGLPRPGGLCPSCVAAQHDERYVTTKDAVFDVEAGFLTDPAVVSPPYVAGSLEVAVVGPTKRLQEVAPEDLARRVDMREGYHTVKLLCQTGGSFIALEDSVFHPPLPKCKTCEDTGKVGSGAGDRMPCPDCHLGVYK